MKKITFIFLLSFIGFFTGFSQVQVGFENNITQYLPFSNTYTYSQSIYLGSEINAPGSITSIQWYYNGTGAMPNSQQLVIYLGTTTKTVFSSTTDWEPITNLTQVYSGGITTGSTPGWKTITLTTPFVYNGTSNLIVAVDENQSGTDLFNDKFYNSSVIGSRSIYNIYSTTNIDPATPPTANSIVAFVPNIIFGGITQACETPYLLTTSNIGTTTATVSWQASTTPPSGGSEYYVSTSNAYPDPSAIPTGSVVGSATTANMTLLNPNTNYYVRVRNNCASNGYSSWSDAAPFLTDCIPTSAFNQNFDTTTIPNLPSCWNKILRGTSLSVAASLKTVGFVSNSPLNSIEFKNSGSSGEYDIIAVSPALSNLSLATHRLKFFFKGPGTIEIGTLNNNTNTATFNVISSITNSTSNFIEYVVPFSGYTGPDDYIGIRMNAPAQSLLYVDNVIWEPLPGCPDVTQVVVSTVTPTTATIGWSDGGSESSWDIAVGPTTATDPNLLPIENTTVSGTYLKTGLTGSTSYKVWVRSVCGGTLGNGAWIGPVSFTTDCDAIAAFNENFNTVTAPALPSCWGKILRANSGILSPFANVVTSSSVNVIGTTNSVMLVSNTPSTFTSSGNYDVILVSPKTTSLATGDNYRLKFYSRYNTGSVEIGTLNSNTNTAVFTPFTSVQFVANGELTQYIVDFSNYNGTDEYIGFRKPNVDSQQFISIALDNIVWEPIPLCPEVSGINVPEVSTTTANIVWTSTPAETSWQVAVGAITATDPDTLTALPAATPSYYIANLTPSTSYNVWVRAVCGGVNGNGAWIGPVIFTTACPPVATFSEHFDTTTPPDLPSCWSKILRGGTNLSQFAYVNNSTIAWVATVPNFTVPNFVSINPQGSNNQADIILVSPNISTLGQAYRLKFDTYSQATIEVGTLDGNTNAAVFTVFQTITLNGLGGSYVVNFSNFTGTIHTNNHIGFRTVIPTPTDFPSYFIDNIVWEPIPLCPDVTQIVPSALTDTSATIGWTTGGGTSWQVAVGATSVSDPNTLTALPATTTSLVVNGLTASTSYKVWIRSVCSGPTYGAWIGPIIFTTECAPVNVNYTVDFETSVVPNMPTCTAAINTNSQTTTINWETFNGDSANGFPTKALRCKSTATLSADAWYYTRGINLTQGQNYTIYYKKGSSSGFQTLYNLKVKYGTSTTAAAMTNSLADYVGFTGPGINESVNFTVPTTGVYYFGFNDYSNPGAGYIYLDDIVVDVALSNNDFDISKFNYYPNPVKDVLNLSYNKEITLVTIYNLLGQVVLTQSTKTTNVAVDLSKLSNGTYMVKITSDDLQKTFKVIKQ